jgi:hypothetical protein
MASRLLLPVALLCLSCTGYAQSDFAGRYQLYGGYTFLSNSFNGVPGSTSR